MLESLALNLLSSFLTSKLFFYAIAFTFVFWLLWVTLNILYNRMSSRGGWRKVAVGLLFWPLLPLGVIVDVVYNFTVAAVLFLEWPHESTLSMRLTRYISRRPPGKKGQVGTKDYGYRTPLAVWLATYLIEPWAKGHIGLERYGYPGADDLLSAVMNKLKRWLP